MSRPWTWGDEKFPGDTELVAAIEAYLADHLCDGDLGAVEAPSGRQSHLQVTVSLVPDDETPEEAAELDRWLAERPEADALANHEVMAGALWCSCGDSFASEADLSAHQAYRQHSLLDPRD